MSFRDMWTVQCQLEDISGHRMWNRWQLIGTENAFWLLRDRVLIVELREMEDPKPYLKARFSIMSVNEMSACKGRTDKYERVMVL